MLLKMVHKQEQQINSEQTALHLFVTEKERPGEVFYNVDVYVLVTCI